MDPRLKCALSGLVLLALAGCSTPPAALNQARNTAALTVSLAAEQREFKRVQTVIASQRLESIRRQTAALEGYESMAKFDERVMGVAGLTDQLQMYQTLRDLSDSRARDEADLAAALKAIDDSLTTVVTPIPESASRISALQNALLPLGEELSPEDRVKEAVKFARSVRDGLDESREKLKAAEAATPAAPAQK